MSLFSTELPTTDSGTWLTLLITFWHDQHRKHCFHRHSLTIPTLLHVYPLPQEPNYSCPAIGQVLLMCLPAITKQACSFSRWLHSNSYTCYNIVTRAHELYEYYMGFVILGRFSPSILLSLANSHSTSSSIFIYNPITDHIYTSLHTEALLHNQLKKNGFVYNIHMFSKWFRNHSVSSLYSNSSGVT
jgi:hypothetical protein